MRILSIDYGTKRIGLALSDEANQFALPHSVLANDPDILAGIEKIAHENGVKEIVLGESKNYKGEANDILSDSMLFKQELEDKGFTVYLEPEFMTSMHAERLQGRNDKTDASAAAIILQTFLDKRRNENAVQE